MYISTCTTSTRLQPSRLAPVLRQAISEATGLDTHDASSIDWTPAVHGNPGGSKKHTADYGQGQPCGGGAASPQQNKEDRWSTYLVAMSVASLIVYLGTGDGDLAIVYPGTSDGGSRDGGARETCIRATEELRKVTRNRRGFPKCLNFRRIYYELLKRSFFLSC